MLHFLVGLGIALFVLGPAWAKCDPNNVRIERTTSFALSLGPKSQSNFGTNMTVNIPLVIDGKPACYHQQNGILISTERAKENEFVEYEITPLSAEFENVPSPMTYQYMHVELDSDNKSSKVHMMSFLCSGETPIGGDAFSDSLQNLAENVKSPEASTEVFIATGQAAENISISQEKKTKAKVYDRFLEIYEDRGEENESIDNDQTNIYIPNVLTGISVNSVTSVERKLYSAFFSRTSSSINGCSKKFLNKMQDLLIENVAKNQPFKGIELKKKRFSSKYKMKWVISSF
jgi:hypothetical protein